jgi:Ca2+-binding EF-hand superfamily protein
MGNNLSLNEQELQDLSNATQYSPEVISNMYTKFAKLDKEEKGYVSISDLTNACDFEQSEITNMILSQFSCGLGDQIDFRGLVHALSYFQNKQEDKKLRCKGKIDFFSFVQDDG